MERVPVDIAGPLPLSAQGSSYICVAMDCFTKWPEAYAILDHEKTTVVKVLVNDFCHFMSSILTKEGTSSRRS